LTSTPKDPGNKVELREVIDSDLPIFYEQQMDPEARDMAAFGSPNSGDRQFYMQRWEKISGDPNSVARTVLFDGQVAGNILSFVWEGERAVGYWIGKEYWGKGVATAALRAFLNVVTERPLIAMAARDNLGSLRVLEKCGFVVTGYAKNFGNLRGEETEEALLKLG
jgi:RimJ/RimL family protein N-acetyltransferase